METLWMAKLEQKKQIGNMSLSAAAHGLVIAREEAGKWVVLWEPDGQAPEIWFEGTIWAEMRAALRLGMARLLLAGYVLSIGFVPEVDLHERRMKGRSDWIACYADLYTRPEVYEHLARWRREKASKLRRTPFWIATNRMLRMVSALLPYTLEELGQLPGFGAAKLSAYGADVLAIVKPFERNTAFPLDWIPSVVSEEKFMRWVYTEWELKQHQELKKLTARRLLLEGLEQRLSFEQLMKKLQVDRRELIMQLEMVEQKGCEVKALLESTLASMPESFRSRVEFSFQELGDEYLKPIYIRVYGEAALEKSYADIQGNYEQLRLLRLLHRSKAGIAITQAS